MSYNRYDALSLSDAESLEFTSDSPTSVLDRHNKNKRQGKKVKMILEAHEVEQDKDEKDFDAYLLLRLRAVRWLTFNGKPIDKEVLKKYLNEVKESGGFDVNHFPGYIRGVTRIRPHLDISYKHDKMMELATTAMKTYNKKHHQSHFKVAEIKRVNSLPGGHGCSYYITFDAVDVKGLKHENDSIQSSIFRQFATTTRSLMIIMVTLLVWLGVFFPPYNHTVRSLERLLLKMKSGPELKASEYELRERTGDCTTYQAKVWADFMEVRSEGLFCRAVPK